jgi:hypothetical protein
VTITLDEEVYDGLVRTVGRKRISRFLEDLARPYVTGEDELAAAYRAMAADADRENRALEWSEALIADASDAAR